MGVMSQVVILQRWLSAESSCALNLTNPAGVKLLNRDESVALDWLLSADGQVARPPRDRDVPVVHEIAGRLGITSGQASLLQITRKPRRDLTVWIHTSNGCNLSCSYCYIPKLAKALTAERAIPHLMASEVSTRMIRGLVAVCQEEGFGKVNLKFAGGEPTLNWDEVVRTCEEASRVFCEAGIQVGFRMLTNGVFDPQAVIPMVETLNMKVSISVDGDPDAHDAVRFLTPKVASELISDEDSFDSGRPRRRGTWPIVKANITRLVEAGARPFLMCTVDERNYRQLTGMVGYCAARKLPFRLSPVRDKRTYQIPGLQDGMAAELIRLYRWMGDNHPVDMPIEGFARFAEWNLRKRKTLACGSCRSMLAVGESGQVASCQMRLDKPIANIGEDTFAGAFGRLRSSADYTYFVRPQAKTGGCAGCQFRYTCAGGCPEHTRSVFGTNDHVSPWCDLYTALMPEYVEAIGRQLQRSAAPSSLYPNQHS
jgi:uncharacterized protein